MAIHPSTTSRVVPGWEVCPGQVVPLRAEAAPDPRCPTELEYRFVEASGRVAGCQGCHAQAADNDYLFTGSLSP